MRVYCDMSTAGGGWSLVAKVTDSFRWICPELDGADCERSLVDPVRANLFHQVHERDLVDLSIGTGSDTGVHVDNSISRYIFKTGIGTKHACLLVIHFIAHSLQFMDYCSTTLYNTISISTTPWSLNPHSFNHLNRQSFRNTLLLYSTPLMHHYGLSCQCQVLKFPFADRVPDRPDL